MSVNEGGDCRLIVKHDLRNFDIHAVKSAGMHLNYRTKTHTIKPVHGLTHVKDIMGSGDDDSSTDDKENEESDLLRRLDNCSNRRIDSNLLL